MWKYCEHKDCENSKKGCNGWNEDISAECPNMNIIKPMRGLITLKKSENTVEWLSNKCRELENEIKLLKAERDLQDAGKAELFKIIESVSPELMKAIKDGIYLENKKREKVKSNNSI